MKNITLVFIILFLTGCGGPPQPGEGGGKDNISLITCSPKGILPNWKENRFPKEFWINVYVDLEVDLNNLQSPSSQCVHVVGGRNTECIYSVQNYQNSLRKCLEHSRQMCKLNGCVSIK